MKLSKRLNKTAPFIMPNIQFFAEGGEGEPTPPAGDGGSSSGGEGDGTQTFDDLMKDKAHQGEFDRRVAKAIETAKGKWKLEQDKALEDAKSEAQKLAKMNAEEKAKYEKEKQEADYNKRLADLTTRELRAEARETLSKEGLPAELAEVLSYTDAEACKQSIESVKAAFQSALEKAVNEKLRGPGAPRSGSAPVGEKATLEARFKDPNISFEERIAIKNQLLRLGDEA